MSELNLYHVQDDDRPMYVFAISWSSALEGWREHIRSENTDDPCDEPIEPNGIALVAPSSEVLLVVQEPVDV